MKQEIENQDMPEVGELVLALVTSMSSHGAKVVLEEYNNMYGFLHVSEMRCCCEMVRRKWNPTLMI